jgi:Lar family restriction alleviation protein
MSAELKPCPFCGGKAYRDRVDDKPLFWVACLECGIDGRICESEPEAITAWNRRPPESSERVPLSEVQISDLMPINSSMGRADTLRWMARAIERAHGIPSPAESSVQINAKGGE